ncbi:Hypothetical protein D9617_3g022860 [Elsinoe fawcettii]|nr:Hypothetical protein D9617_3g022860 [Elsinoe fawcettii]
MGNQDGLMLSYYETRISTMISTIDVETGFQRELLPMALSDFGVVSLSLQNAMMAVAAVHQGGTFLALPYKTKAIEQLSMSLQTEYPDAITMQIQFAASMMLCVYNVFDESESDWLIHLQGALQMMSSISSDLYRDSSMRAMISWAYYHYVLGDFTHPEMKDVFPPANQNLNEHETKILGALGCSLQLLRIIHRINTLCSAKARAIDDESANYLLTATLGEVRALHQYMPTVDHDTPTDPQVKALLTAELYRLGTLLYLYRVLPSLADIMERSRQLYSALRLLRRMPVCTSPWPLFIIAGEVETDEERLCIVEILDRMDGLRNIGNVFIVRRLVEMYWKQIDLRVGADDTCRLCIWDLLETETAMPWFI